jgi:hypothetical protein
MDNIAVKLVVSPLLIGAASLVGRRWGQSVAGWLVGLPLTTGPVVFFLALDYGAGFAAHAAVGAIAGTAAQAGFCFAYAQAARRFGWSRALAAATLGFALAAMVYKIVTPPLPVLLPIVIAALAAALWSLPRPRVEAPTAKALPKWDLPARMLVAAGIILGLGAAAPLIGPHLAGFISTYPVFATVLTVFAQRLEGEVAARRVLRGLLIGLFGFTAFFAVLALALEPLGIAAAFLCATLAALTVQGYSLSAVRRSGLSPRTL